MSKDIKYIIKPKDRMVICVHYCDPYAVSMYLDTHHVPLFMGYFASDYKIKNYYVGVAKCAPEDKWNEDTGKLIALRKAKKKYYSAFFSKVNKYFTKLDCAVDRAQDACDIMGMKWEKNIEKLDKKIVIRVNG